MHATNTGMTSFVSQIIIYLVYHKHIVNFHYPLCKLISSYCSYQHDINNIQLDNDEISNYFQCNDPKVRSNIKNILQIIILTGCECVYACEMVMNKTHNILYNCISVF